MCLLLAFLRFGDLQIQHLFHSLHPFRNPDCLSLSDCEGRYGGSSCSQQHLFARLQRRGTWTQRRRRRALLSLLTQPRWRHLDRAHCSTPPTATHYHSPPPSLFHPPFSTAPNPWPVAAGAGVVHQRGALAAAAAASPLLLPPEASVAAAGSVRGRRCCFPAGVGSVGGLRCSFSLRPREPPVAGKISSLLLLYFSIHIISHQLVSVFRGGLLRSRTIWQAKHGGALEPQEQLSWAKQELEHFTQELLSKQQHFNTPHVMVIGSAGGRTSNLL